MRRRIVGQDVPLSEFKEFMDSWSINQAEINHVETLEEANDFYIPEEEDEDIIPSDLTVYELHEIEAENYTESGALTPEPGHAAPETNVEESTTAGGEAAASPPAGGGPGGRDSPPARRRRRQLNPTK